jgi:anti-sigma B factor antagonist
MAGVILGRVEAGRIDVDRSDTGVVVVVVGGEHDVSTAPSLRDRVTAVLEERTPLVIDLTPASFLDSSVLRVLLEARRRAHEEDLGFAVALGHDEAPEVRRILEITGLIPVFPVLSDRSEALERARSGQEQR